ncbi:MAG: hypothetical protein F4Z35_03785 [Dehalococcoidia bacterium]|nr:hypothetical protein [Dehalococcoidia bacterium]
MFTPGLIFIAILAGSALLWLSIGILWAPFGGLICALRARSLGLPAVRFAVVGAVYSLAMFLPWVYLIRRMTGGWFSDGLIATAYILLYAVWAGIWSYPFLGAFAYKPFDPEFGLFLTTLLVSLILSCLWIYFIRRMRDVHIRRSTIVIAYAILYAICIGLVGIGLHLAEDTLSGRIVLRFLMYMNVASLLASVLVAWLVPAPADEPECLLPPFKHIFPFALLSLNTAALIYFLISGCC